MPTMHAGSFSAKVINVSRLILRRMTTAPDASRPTTPQTFLPRSTPRTEISIPFLLLTAGDPMTPEGGAGHSIKRASPAPPPVLGYPVQGERRFRSRDGGCAGSLR